MSPMYHRNTRNPHTYPSSPSFFAVFHLFLLSQALPHTLHALQIVLSEPRGDPCPTVLTPFAYSIFLASSSSSPFQRRTSASVCSSFAVFHLVPVQDLFLNLPRNFLPKFIQMQLAHSHPTDHFLRVFLGPSTFFTLKHTLMR